MMNSQTRDLDATDSSAKLTGGLTNAIGVMEEYLRATASQTGEKIGALRDRLQEQINNYKNRITETTEIVVEKTKVAARATDDFVNDNPWCAMGIAAGVGVVIGMLISARDRE